MKRGEAGSACIHVELDQPRFPRLELQPSPALCLGRAQGPHLTPTLAASEDTYLFFALEHGGSRALGGDSQLLAVWVALGYLPVEQHPGYLGPGLAQCRVFVLLDSERGRGHAQSPGEAAGPAKPLGGQPGSTAMVARPRLFWTKGRWAERQHLWPLLRVDSTWSEGLQGPEELPGRPHVGAEARLFQKIPSQVAGQDMWEVSTPETGADSCLGSVPTSFLCPDSQLEYGDIAGSCERDAEVTNDSDLF